ncbi:hypothetical protein [Dactylosporangium sp. NPDC000521]|uniref:hypothetical protein n=1 Tax=Dactylosporangium sp. NPDC000521 TaxID=3363975 RepID=UPI0036CBEC67
MTTSNQAFPADQQLTTGWGVTFTPFYDPARHDPAGQIEQVSRVGFRAVRDGLTDLVYLAAPHDPGNGPPLVVTAHSRPDTTAEDDPDDAVTSTATVDLPGPVTAWPWTDGHSVGWRLAGLHGTRYVYLCPSVDGDVADTHLYISASDDPDNADDAEPVVWLPVHERTASRLAAVEPVTGAGVTFNSDAFTDWFTAPPTQQTLPGSVTGRYDSADPDDGAGLRVQLLLDHDLPGGVWKLGTGVAAVNVWPTTDPEASAAGDGGAVITIRYGGVDLSAGT